MQQTFLDEEQADLKPDLASYSKRIFVSMIDAVNCLFLSYALSYLFSSMQTHTGHTISLVILIAYKIIGEKKGWPTFGKYIYKTEVVKKDLSPAGWPNIVRRNILWIAMLLVYILIHYVLVLFFMNNDWLSAFSYYLYSPKFSMQAFIFSMSDSFFR